MTYQEVFEKLKKTVGKGNVKNINEHIAYQFHIVGDGEGTFYIEVLNNKLNVEPYDYQDRNLAVDASANVLEDIFANKIMLQDAIDNGSVVVFGDTTKVSVLQEILTKKVKEEKKTVKKDKKEEVKAEVKEEIKTEDKKESKKETAKPKKQEKKEPAKKEVKSKKSKK